MPLVTLQDVFLSYGQPPLIDHLDLVIEPNERVCLIGRNGAGKSTLMKDNHRADYPGRRLNQARLAGSRLPSLSSRFPMTPAALFSM